MENNIGIEIVPLREAKKEGTSTTGQKPYRAEIGRALKGKKEIEVIYLLPVLQDAIINKE
jgi:hypothetical protein